MVEVWQDLWTVPAAVICITTNGGTNGGNAIMGRGCALEATQRCPGIERVLGAYLRAGGNHVYFLGHWFGRALLSFPVKREDPRADADMQVIRRSCVELVNHPLIQALPADAPVALPRPGCGAGKLPWPAVRELVRFYLAGPRWLLVAKPGEP